MHFVYLPGSAPGVSTADHFRDVVKLQLDPAFVDYMGEAFRPLGVYINCFQPTLQAGATRTFPVMMVNDEARPLHGRLALTLETKSGEVLTRCEQAFAIEELGARTYQVSLAIPHNAGDCVLKAVAQPQDKGSPATVCRRWTSVAE